MVRVVRCVGRKGLDEPLRQRSARVRGLVSGARFLRRDPRTARPACPNPEREGQHNHHEENQVPRFHGRSELYTQAVMSGREITREEYYADPDMPSSIRAARPDDSAVLATAERELAAMPGRLAATPA